uniref:Serine/threonine-protein phosphatase with EF-hands n=1 Tax=Mesocestoides corti TaxID=53468 RepID=A0A5K3EGX3_MESCO
MRRRCAWKIYELFEYSGIEDQRDLKEFFTWILNNYGQAQTLPPSSTTKTNLQMKGTLSHNFERRLQKMSLMAKSDSRCKGHSFRSRGSCEHSRLNNDYIQNIIDFQKQDKILDPELVSDVLEEATVILQAVPNIQTASTTLSQRITICGDLHGQVEDLTLIFNMNGLPDIFNPYIFNGDFVDRGSHSMEVLIILLCCLIAHPSAVYLNRGNHEDPVLNKRYGFADEIRLKYPKHYRRILKQVEQLFCAMPICTILDEVILVCHGGLSRTTDLTKVAKLDRKGFSSVLQPPLEGEKAVPIEDWRQILDLLWSDPQTMTGCKPNIKRGGGSYFGPDVTASLLSHLKIGILIRSHECCPNGWKLDHNKKVLTVFSASDYYGPNSNLGAFVQLSSQRVVSAAQVEAKISIAEPAEETIRDLPPFQQQGKVRTAYDTSSIIFTRIIKQADNREDSGTGQKHITETLIIPRVVTFRAGNLRQFQTNLSRKNSSDVAFRMLLKRIMSRKSSILAALHEYDKRRTGEVTITQWCTVMLKMAGQNLPWRILRYSLVRPSITHPKTHVFYMSMFDPKHEIYSDSMKRKLTSECYANLDELVSIFKQFDNENNGFVSVENFKEKCKQLYSDKGITSNSSTIAKLAMLLDFNNDGIIDFNEFIEGSRLVQEN